MYERKIDQQKKKIKSAHEFKILKYYEITWPILLHLLLQR